MDYPKLTKKKKIEATEDWQNHETMRTFRGTVLPKQKWEIWKWICLSVRGKGVLPARFVALRDGSRSVEHFKILLDGLLCPISVDTSSLEGPKYLKMRQVPPKYKGLST